MLCSQGTIKHCVYRGENSQPHKHATASCNDQDSTYADTKRLTAAHGMPEADSPVGEEGTSATQAEEAVAHQHGAVIAHIPVLCDVLVVHDQCQPVGQSLHSQAQVNNKMHPAPKTASLVGGCTPLCDT